MSYVIIPKPNCLSREGINYRCRRFDLLLFVVLSQSVAVMTAVVAVLVVSISSGRWRSTENSRGESFFAPVSRRSRRLFSKRYYKLPVVIIMPIWVKKIYLMSSTILMQCKLNLSVALILVNMNIYVFFAISKLLR